MPPTVSQAVDQNAAWCDLVCRTHGLAPRSDGRVWRSTVPTPPFHPEAITLDATVGADEVVAALGGPAGLAGRSVKDSFAALDLAPHGFDVLFEATWIGRPPAVAPPEVASPAHGSWHLVADDAGFARWEAAWRGADGPADVLRPSLLAADGVAVMARPAGGTPATAATAATVTAGGIAHRHGSVVGVGNVFPGGEPEVWAGLLVLLDRCHPGVGLVGYEQGDDLAAALAHGFVALGPLRVWVRP